MAPQNQNRLPIGGFTNPLDEAVPIARGFINPLEPDEGSTPTPMQTGFVNPLESIQETEPPSMSAVTPAAGEAPQPLAQMGGSPIVRGKIEYPEEYKDNLAGVREAIDAERNKWNKIINAETPSEALGLTGAAELAGGVAVGGAEWLAQNIMGMSAGVYTKFATDWTGKESLAFGNKVAGELIEGLKDVAPDAVQRFMGRPQTPEAKEFLEGVGTLLDATVGKLGNVGAEFVGGYVKGIAEHVPEGYGKQTLLEAVPWAEQIGRFGVELLAFKGAHKVGRYVSAKVKAGEAPPSRAATTPDQPIVLDLLQEDFQPAAAARRVSKEVDATIRQSTELPQKATLLPTTVSRYEELGVRPTFDKPQGLYTTPTDVTSPHKDLGGTATLHNVNKEAKTLKIDASDTVAKEIDDTLTKGEKAALQAQVKEAVHTTLREADIRTVELDLEAGRIGEELASTLRENVRVQDKQFQQRVTVEQAITQYETAISEGKLPPGIIPESLDSATNRPIPFGNRGAALVRSNALAKEGVIAAPVKIPGSRYHALRLLEDGRVIRASRDTPFTEKGATARQRALARDGITSELANIEGGYELHVTSYTKRAAAERIRELRSDEVTGLSQFHSGIPPDEFIKRLLKRVGGKYDIDELLAQRAKWLEGVEKGRKIMAARAAKAESDNYRYMHSGIPIPPDLAGKIRRYARERGTSVLSVLRKKGYSDESAGKMTAHIEEMGKIYEDNLTNTSKLKDSVRNRAALRKRTLMLGEGNGLLTSKPIKKGRPVGQFSVAEVQSFLTEHDLPLTTPLREATRHMRKSGIARQTQVEYKDRGFAAFVQATTGKPWTRDLTVNELTALGNAIGKMYRRTGEYVLKQEGGKPPITDAHLGMLGSIAHLKPQGVIESTTWFADRLDQSAPGFAREFIYPVLTAENNTVLEVVSNRNRLYDFMKERGVTREDREAVGTWAISKQENGAAILEAMGKEAKPLTTKQSQLYEYIRTEVFEPLFTRINEARAKQGQDPISYTENYFTFFRDLTDVAGDGIEVLNSTASALKQRMTKARQISFGQLKKRIGSKRPVELDAGKVAERYLLSATHYVNTSPPLNALRSVIEAGFSRDKIVAEHGEAAWPPSVKDLKAFSLKGSNKDLYKSFNAWINHVAGVPVEDVGWHKVNSVASTLNKNLAYSILSANIGSTMRQFGAWRHTWFGTSMRDMVKGIYRTAEEFTTAERGTRFGEKAKLRGAFLESDRLASRVFDVMARHTYDVLEGKAETQSFLPYLQDKLGRAGLRPLAATDAIAARVAYYAFESKGKRMGLKGQDLKEFIDNNITKTQGSGTKAEVPPILRTPVGRTFALFQTYVLNEWNYLSREVLGRGRKTPTVDRIGKVFRYMYITAAMSTAFEAMGVRSPFPTPIDAFTEAKEKGASTFEALLRSAFELAEPIPFIGGALRFGTTMGGPLASLTADIAGALHGDPFSPPLLVSAAKLFGVPGTTAFYNAYRQLAKDTDDNVRGRRRSSRSTRSSRTRSAHRRTSR